MQRTTVLVGLLMICSLANPREANSQRGAGAVAGGSAEKRRDKERPNEIVESPRFNWKRELTSNLLPGPNTVSLTDCPIGVDVSTNNPYYVTINNGAETDLVTGGTCTEGASGTITFTALNAYTTPTIGAANAGIQEALNYAAGTAAAGNSRWHVVVPPAAYNVYAPIVIHASKGLLEGDGADLECFTKSWCMQAGNLTNSNTFNAITVRGFRFMANAVDSGCAITQTARAAGAPATSTVTFASSTGCGPFKVGDWIRVDYTDDTAYWGDHLVSAATSNSVSWLGGKAAIAAQLTPGTLAHTNDAILDNATPTKWEDLKNGAVGSRACVNTSFLNICQFNAFFDFFDDENATIEDFDSDGGGMMCGINYCGSFVYSGGSPGPGYGNGGNTAAVIYINHSSMTAGCANGVTVYNSNGLHIQDSVIQATALWNVMVSNLSGNYQGAQLDNIYYESVGCPKTPWGALGVAGAIYGPSSGGSTFTSHGIPLQGKIPQTGNGSTTFNYWIVGHDTTARSQTAPMLVAQALNNQTGSITVNWPRLAASKVGTQSPTDTITYDVIRTSGVLHGGWPPSSGPMPGNCLGGSITACGSVATGVAQCSRLTCTFNDGGSAATSAYAVNLAGTFEPTMTYWPGDLVLGGTVPSQVFLDKVPPTVNAPQGISAGPVLYALRCGADEGTWVGCAADEGYGPGSIPVPAASVMANVIGNPLQGVKTPKGRLNFYDLNGNAFGGTGIITLWDSNPGKTLATVGNRPAMDAADTYLASDNAGQGFSNNQVQLAIGAPVSISEYINKLPDDKNWAERLTAKAKIFNVPLELNEGLTNYRGIPTHGAGIAPIYATVALKNLTGPIRATTLCDASSCHAGQYELDVYFSSTEECTRPGTSSVGIGFNYEDDGGQKRSVPLPLSVNGEATLSPSMALGSKRNSAAGHTTFWSTGSAAIEFATSYASCETGNGTYSLHIALKQLQF